MPNSNRQSLFGTNTKGQAVTVIEARTRYSQRRKATVAFWVTLFTVGLLTGTVASHYWHPIVGGLFGLVTGAVLGAVAFALIIAWPVLRIVWWWLPEIGIGAAVVYGWMWLMMATPLWLALVLVSVGVGLPAAFRRSRRWVLAPVWCLTVRHRLRTCFAAFIATNRSGTLPLILWARPTPAGERVWIWLRPGLSLRDLEQDGQVQKLAVACWANEARVARASRRYAAFIRVDITRRDPVANLVPSDLPQRVPADRPATAPVSPALPPLGINLADIPSAPRPVRSPFDLNESRPRRSRRPEPADTGEVDPSDYA